MSSASLQNRKSKTGYGTRTAVSHFPHHYSNKCVCEICTCNRHRCPDKHTGYDPNLKSTFKNDYPPHDLQGRPNKKNHPPYVPLNYAPDLMKTTFQNDFTPKRVWPDQRKKDDYVPCLIPFNGESEYKKNYIENNLPHTKPYKSQYGKSPASDAPFQGSSTYANSYKGKQGTNQRYKPQVQPDSHMPFNGSSTYQNDFLKFNVPGTQSQAHKRPYVPNNAPFDGLTQYQQHYIQHGVKPYMKEHCPIHDLPPRPQSCYKGKNHLDYHSEIDDWE